MNSRLDFLEGIQFKAPKLFRLCDLSIREDRNTGNLCIFTAKPRRTIRGPIPYLNKLKHVTDGYTIRYLYDMVQGYIGNRYYLKDR